ncbi:MAG TPA: adenosylhomocysteinase [Actinomycetota bacterium]|nr:adenosylhomocysteinase [Actinomycetota bacterium]
MNGHIADPGLAEKGRIRIDWADQQMPVLREIRARFAKEKPLAGLKIAACLHVTTETANLMRALVAGGADAVLCASNPLSTQDDVAAALDADGIPTYAIKGEDNETYYSHIESVIAFGPQITMDDGADVVSILHSKHPDKAAAVLAGTEETTTGVIRLRQMAAENVLMYPIVAVNDTPTKHMFDNRYGTGQSTLDGITRATNILWASRTVVVCGYGFGGKGLSMRARGLGAQVIVTEVDPVKALEAVMDGYRVMPIADAAREGDVFITVTGDRDVLRGEHFEMMKDGAILANTGHFDVEIDKNALASLATDEPKKIRDFVEEFRMSDGRRLYLLAQGRLVNLAAAEGHPATVMDMSFADQALTAEWLAKGQVPLEKRVYDVPREIDEEVARLKLQTLGLRIDELTPEQVKYLSSWREGT